MRFKSISVRNFLSIRALEDLTFGDITLVCGDNRVGKSSVQNAVRLVLCGEVSRVKLKGDWPQLVRQSPGITEARVDLSFEHDKLADEFEHDREAKYSTANERGKSCYAGEKRKQHSSDVDSSVNSNQ